MTPFATMRRALSDRHLLGAVLGGDSWLAWRVLLIAAMGEALTDDERSIFAKLTGREREPGERVDELWCVIGRRGGKSRAIAALLVYLATMVDYRSQLVLGGSAAPSRFMLELTGASSGDMRLSDHAARSMI
jgi:hypothetical protein